MSILGITDPWIWSAYVASFLCVAFCVAYGILKGRNGAEEDDTDDS